MGYDELLTKLLKPLLFNYRLIYVHSYLANVFFQIKFRNILTLLAINLRSKSVFIDKRLYIFIDY